MKIEYIIEILEYYEISYDISFIESKPDELIIENKSEIYDISEFLSENYFSHEILSESYDSIILKLNLKNMASEISSYYDLMLNYKEIKLYLELLENSSDYYKCFNRIDEYKNSLGTNELNDIIHKFHMNHKDYYSFNLDESGSDAYDLFNELIDESDLYNEFKFIIYENLDEFYKYESCHDELFKYRNYTIKISDESNILIDLNSFQIRNINESDYKKILEYVIKENFFYHNKIDIEKINEFIELYNSFSDYNSYEILENNEYNLNYIHNKLLISFDSFKKYSNKDEFLLIKYNKTNENESIDSYNNLIENSDELLSDLINASEYYEYDSYEFNEFIKNLKLLS